MKQTVIIAPTMEAKFVACFEATIQGNWLLNFISRLAIVDATTRLLKIYCDNFVAIFFAKNDKYLKGAKHMELKYLVIKEEVHKQKVSIEHISTNLMVVNPLTKRFHAKAFIGHVKRMDIIEKS